MDSNEIKAHVLAILIITATFALIAGLIRLSTFSELASINSIFFTETLSINLPFSVSNWFNIIIAPVWYLGFCLFYYLKPEFDNLDTNIFFASIFVGLIIGSQYFVNSLSYFTNDYEITNSGLYWIIIISSLIGLIIGLFSLKYSILISLSFALYCSFFTGIFSNILMGFFVFLLFIAINFFVSLFSRGIGYYALKFKSD